jgi:hypothetical protein
VVLSRSIPTITSNSIVALAAEERMFDLQLGRSPHVPRVGDQLAQPGDLHGLRPEPSLAAICPRRL